MQMTASLSTELLFCVLSSSEALVLVVQVISCHAKAEMLAPSGGNSRFLTGVICFLTVGTLMFQYD